jgi:hypothetical protein
MSPMDPAFLLLPILLAITPVNIHLTIISRDLFISFRVMDQETSAPLTIYSMQRPPNWHLKTKTTQKENKTPYPMKIFSSYLPSLSYIVHCLDSVKPKVNARSLQRQQSLTSSSTCRVREPDHSIPILSSKGYSASPGQGFTSCISRGHLSCALTQPFLGQGWIGS